MSKMKLALNVANDLRKLADSIEAFTREEHAEAEATPAAIDNPPALEDVRKKLATLSQNGKQKEVKELITAFGAKKLSDIPVDKYAEVLQKAGEL